MSALVWADLGALGFLARNKVLGLVTLIKDDAAVKRWPSTPVNNLLQPTLALAMRNQRCVCPAERQATCW